MRSLFHSTQATVVAIALAACTAAPSPPADVPEVEPDVEILTSDSPGGMNALSTFTLVFDAQLNCLYHVEPDNNGEPGTGGRVVIVWPDGYTARSRGDSVTIFNGAGQAVARTGVPFQLAGGGGPATTDHCEAVGQWIANGDPGPVLDG